MDEDGSGPVLLYPPCGLEPKIDPLSGSYLETSESLLPARREGVEAHGSFGASTGL
jgi:hypothetical protein